MEVNTGIALSVIVATRNRSRSLARLLNGLAEQTDAPLFEVIVGDNGSSDDTADVIESARKQLLIRSVYEECPGKSRALNAALKLARGKLILFTDDDVQPYPDWISKIFAASLQYPHVNIFGGRIDVNLDAVPNWIKRSHNLMRLLTCAHHHGDSDTLYSYGQYPFGPNMAIRRNCIVSSNHAYPEHLGPGSNIPVGDESVFLLQFSPLNAMDRMFVPAACVKHEIEAENVNFFGALKRCYMAGQVSGMLGMSNATPAVDAPASTLTLILQRLSACRSLRELTCISARYLGYLKGCCGYRKRGV